MTKIKYVLLLGVLGILSVLSRATTVVSGNIKNLGTSAVSAGTFVRFYLRGCGGNLPRVNGTAIIAPTLGNVFYFDFVPNASGTISGTLYSTRDSTGLLGGDIECGGSTTAVWYGFVPFVNGKAGPETPIHAKNTATIDISNITPITSNPVIAAPTGDSTYCRLDGGNCDLNTGTHTLSTGTVNGDLWVGTGPGQFASIAACNTAAAAGQTCHITAGWSETLSANLVLKSQVCIIAHGLAVINMSTFSITAAHGVPPCIKSLGFASSTSAGPGAQLDLKYSGTGVALDIGDATGDTRGGDLQGIFIEITAAGANSIGVRERRLQGAYHNTVIVAGSGANAATQIGWLLDGTGTFTGNNRYENCGSNGTSVSMRMIVGNLNEINGGNWSTSIASGIGFDLQNAEGNLIKAIDLESTFNAINFANSATVTNNVFWTAFLQSNTTDVTFGAGCKANFVHNAQAGAMTVTDNSPVGNFNNVWGPLLGFRFNSVGQLAISGGTAAAPAIVLPNSMGIHQTATAQVLGISNSSFNFFSFGTNKFGLRSAATMCWATSGDSDTACDVGETRGAAGLLTIDSSTAGNAQGIIAADGNAVYLTADWTCGTGGTVASCVAATIIGSGGGVPLTFTLPLVARSWTWECRGVVGQATGVTANQWNFLTATNGATNVTASYDMNTAPTAITGGATTDVASVTTTQVIGPTWTLGTTGTKMPFHIWGRIEGASASGTVLSLQLLAPTVGDLVTIYRGTGCRIW